jgi:hypothetical protein
MIFVIHCPRCDVDNIVPVNLSTPTVCVKCGESLVASNVEPPSLSKLQSLVDKYLPGRGVRIEYASIKEDGVAYLDKNLIQINPKQSEGLGCGTGYASYNPLIDYNAIPANEPISPEVMVRLEKEAKEKANLSFEERYILTTLHEIAHFLFPDKKPKWVERELEKARKALKENPSETLDLWAYNRWLDNPGKEESFYSYVLGHPNHVKVHKWAWKELLRLRNPPSAQ